MAGNVGLNTPYRASVAEPAVLFYGDFRGRGRGTKRIIEAHYENGSLLPRRTSKAIGAVVPTVRRQFRRNDDFAQATLEEIAGVDKLAAAQRFEATEFRSGVFLSQRDGTFAFSALPRQAQIAPLQGMVVLDFNEDGFEDIYALQNSFAPVPVVGRYDGGGGYFALGQEGGTFGDHPRMPSALVVEGDAKALVLGQFTDGSLLSLMGTRNNGDTFAVLNYFDDAKIAAAVGGYRGLLVRLRGTDGNPAGIGSHVALVLSDGSSIVREIAAGGGYYSQSSPAAGFVWGRDTTPQAIRVRWPDGETTEQAIPSDQTVLTLER